MSNLPYSPMDEEKKGPPSTQYHGVVYPPEQPPSYDAVPSATPVAVTPTLMSVKFGEVPMNIQCPYCAVQIFTSTTRMSGPLTWAIAGGVFMMGGFLGCCLIPFFLDSCKDVEHRCPSCQNVVGYFRWVR